MFALSVRSKQETARRIRFSNILIKLASLLSQQKRLSEMSSLFDEIGLPRGGPFNHRVEDDQELVHTGGQCHLLRLAFLAKSLVERLNHWIASTCHQGCHVQHGSNLGASAPNDLFPSTFATVVIKWRDSHQATNLLVAQTPQLWQVH